MRCGLCHSAEALLGLYYFIVDCSNFSIRKEKRRWEPYHSKQLSVDAAPPPKAAAGIALSQPISSSHGKGRNMKTSNHVIILLSGGKYPARQKEFLPEP